MKTLAEYNKNSDFKLKNNDLLQKIPIEDESVEKIQFLLNHIINSIYDEMKPQEKELNQNIYYKHLMLEARKIRENAYCPYSHFQVGSVFVDENLNSYYGVNVENASYGITLCGERVAVQTGVGQGSRKIKYIVTQAGTPEPKNPCGACRDIISEFGDINTIIIFSNLSFDYKIFNIKQLMPFYEPSNKLLDATRKSLI
ncbi:Cytidine deaminase-like protein [Pseudocohnilembus persalinus]|uniref:Cytidine deaminase-like protein n=1 Tax=Pseudocohnilembus persalinus TaxID=266149 RepID=A0A0V0QM25_PSEPJ|nr:Cytidine deaminase-like protein [Pseudocohnilembus persalinus]|eukprot:KRX03417.1 Cytidine deaminase-like protein [Pseudocohnilembus persalinus]